MSSYDILVVAMACELASIGRREETFLIPCDRRMKRAADKLAETNTKDLMIAGPLGEVEEKRWIPPRCLYLPGINPVELESVLNGTR